mmetsp:Transcript_4902/g.15514  ORF Transcript_4902/g.15514 Transcript_4902/m.15514 type:complete len:348 (-) Transcript_4902:22-1065(-)
MRDWLRGAHRIGRLPAPPHPQPLREAGGGDVAAVGDGTAPAVAHHRRRGDPASDHPILQPVRQRHLDGRRREQQRPATPTAVHQDPALHRPMGLELPSDVDDRLLVDVPGGNDGAVRSHAGHIHRRTHRFHPRVLPAARGPDAHPGRHRARGARRVSHHHRRASRGAVRCRRLLRQRAQHRGAWVPKERRHLVRVGGAHHGMRRRCLHRHPALHPPRLLRRTRAAAGAPSRGTRHRARGRRQCPGAAAAVSTAATVSAAAAATAAVRTPTRLSAATARASQLKATLLHLQLTMTRASLPKRSPFLVETSSPHLSFASSPAHGIVGLTAIVGMVTHQGKRETWRKPAT